MWRSLRLVVLALCSFGTAKKQTSSPGISQFWTDDFKVFDQVYGKTSDKDLFGATLPPSIAYGIDASKVKHEASEKKERYLENHQTSYTDEALDPYGFGARYPSLTNQAVVKTVTPPKITTKFIPADFKPVINKNNDPETYEYLKHLELLQNKKQKFLLQNIGGFKPYFNGGVGNNPEDVENYRSIQDILDAHEANKGNPTDDDENEDQVKYLTYPKHRGPSKKVKPLPLHKSKGKPGKYVKPPCHTGRCRKRATTSYRGRTYLTRPMIRKIKKVYYS